MLPNNPNQPSYSQPPQPHQGQPPQQYQEQPPQQYQEQPPQQYQEQPPQQYQGQPPQQYQEQPPQQYQEQPHQQHQGQPHQQHQGQPHQQYQGQPHHRQPLQQHHRQPLQQHQGQPPQQHQRQPPQPLSPSYHGQATPPQATQNPNPPQNRASQTFQQAPQPQFQQNPVQQPPPQGQQGNPNQHRYPPLQQYPETERPMEHKYPPLSTQAPPPPSPPMSEPEEAPSAPPRSKHPLLMPGSILAMWAEAVDGLLLEDNGDAALLYLHIMRKGHDTPKGWTETRTLQAQLLLRHLGLYRPEACTNQAPKEEHKVIKEVAPQYSTADINLRLSDKDQVFFKLNQKIEDLRNKELSMPDMKILLEIHEYLGFSPDVIFLLYTFVTGRHREQHGAYAIPPMKDVRHEANYWAKAGVKDVATAEELILRRMQRDQWESCLESIFKTKITDSARKHTEIWKTWDFPDSFYELAYDRTVYNTGKFTWKYAHTILENWHIHHYKTVEEIEEKDRLVGKQNNKQGGYRPNKKQNGPKLSQGYPETSAQLQEESQANMERLRKMMLPQTQSDSSQAPLEMPPKTSQDTSPWEGKIEAMFQYKITDSVRKYTNHWQAWNLPDSFYGEAYQRTLYHTGKFSWAYIHKILETWHEGQFQSLDEIHAHDNIKNRKK